MKKVNLAKNITKDGIFIFASIVLVLGAMIAQSKNLNFFYNFTRIVSDSFFIAGLLILLYACICVAYEGGIFHPIGYVVRIVMERASNKSTKKFTRYRDYVESKTKEHNRNYKLIFSISALWIGIGIVFIYF